MNRFDSVFIYKPFTSDEILRLATVMTKNKKKILEERYGWSLNLSDSLISFIAEKALSPIYGARPMERLIEHIISYGIAEYSIANGAIPNQARIEFDLIERATSRVVINIGGSVLEYEVDTDFNSGENMLLSGYNENDGFLNLFQ